MRHVALRLATLCLLVLCLACSGDPTSPTSPTLAGIGSLSSEAPGGNGNGGGKPGGGNGSGDATYELSAGPNNLTLQFGTPSMQTIETYGGGANADSCCIFRFDTNGPNNGAKVNLSFLAGENGGGNGEGNFITCFDPAVTFIDAITPGVILVDVVSGDIAATFTFAAQTMTGATITYELNVQGSTAYESWPPALDDVAEFTLGTWDVTNRSKKDKNKSPCDGVGFFDATMKVKRTL